MRFLFADAASLGEPVAEFFAAANPTIAAVTSLTPADTCAVAAKLSLHFAIQSWENPQAGKAIFWKPAVPLQGLYRVEFGHIEGGAVDRNGLLRATLQWDGRSVQVFCARLSRDPRSADWELVQAARELGAIAEPAIVALDPGGAQLPSLPNLVDAWTAARWRSIAYPRQFDLGDAARAAFGVTPPHSGAVADAPDAEAQVSSLRLLCSPDFSVTRARQGPALRRRGGGAPLVVDLLPVADEDGDDLPAALPRVGAQAGETARSTGTYSA